MKQIILFLLCILSFVFAPAGSVKAESEYGAEIFTYTIRKFGIKAGETVIQYHGLVESEGEPRLLITFTAKGFNFLDDEKIFADPHTLLPLRVERDLNIFGKRERIVEHYEPENHKVTIKKYQKDILTEEIVFEKDEPIDNLYCYIFRYRKQGFFEEGQAFVMPLPTKDVHFEIIRRETIAALNSRREAWFMQSRPAEYQVWFSADDEKIPLRIDGAVGLAKTIMVLDRYEKVMRK